jgi:hypothetical protein
VSFGSSHSPRPRRLILWMATARSPDGSTIIPPAEYSVGKATPDVGAPRRRRDVGAPRRRRFEVVPAGVAADLDMESPPLITRSRDCWQLEQPQLSASPTAIVGRESNPAEAPRRTDINPAPAFDHRLTASTLKRRGLSSLRRWSSPGPNGRTVAGWPPITPAMVSEDRREPASVSRHRGQSCHHRGRR